MTATELGLLGCHGCGLTLRRGPGSYCPRCGMTLHERKPDSLARSWALVIAAVILYLPANLLPVMYTTELFDTESNTILSGVIELWKNGQWDLAVIVFVASICVPILKLAVLALLLLTIRARSGWRLHERARLYRMVEFIGRWSMLDVFVVALLLSLVQFDMLANVRAGPGIVPFCAVVILTMLASKSFDPRLLWDAAAEEHKL